MQTGYNGCLHMRLGQRMAQRSERVSRFKFALINRFFLHFTCNSVTVEDVTPPNSGWLATAFTSACMTNPTTITCVIRSRPTACA